MKRWIGWQLIAVTSCVGFTGCASIPPDWKKHLPWTAEARLKKSEFDTPTHMVAVWSPDILTQPGKPPTRGFGGRLYFYNDKNQAIPVEGQLIVYGYNESKEKHPEGNPDRKFAFTPEQFKSHYSASDLGASYSIWIPWDGMEGDRTSISLVPVFTASTGHVVMGQQARNMLPGKKPNLETGLAQGGPASTSPTEASQPIPSAVAPAASTPMSAVQPAGANLAIPGEQVAPAPSAAPRLRTSTIEIPRSMQLRLQRAQDGGPSPVTLPPSASTTPAWGVIQTSNQVVTPATAAGNLPGTGTSPPAATAISPPTSAQGSIQAHSALAQRPTRFEHWRPQVPASPGVPTSPAAAAWPHAPATPPSAPPLTAIR